jgi:hypothetical protein
MAPRLAGREVDFVNIGPTGRGRLSRASAAGILAVGIPMVIEER